MIGFILKLVYLIYPGRGQALPSSGQSSLGDSDQFFECPLAFVTTTTPAPHPRRACLKGHRKK